MRRSGSPPDVVLNDRHVSARQNRPSDPSKCIRLPISVSIPRTEAELNLLRQQHTFYVIQVVAFGLSSQIRKPFEDFETLHSKIAQKVRFQLPALPPTYWYGNEEAKTVEDRRLRLEGLLRQLLLWPEALLDGEETLLRFLGLPKAAAAAARFVISPMITRCSWLQTLYETTAQPTGFVPLQEPLVEAALLAVVDAAVSATTAEGATGRSIKSSDLVLACELLARGFRSRERPGEFSPSGRADQVRVLLAACTFELTEDKAVASASSAHIHRSARKALLTLARSGRSAWSQTLAEFIQNGGLKQLALAAEIASLAVSAPVDSGLAESEAVSSLLSDGALRAPPLQSERLVAELLLRGLDGAGGPVLRNFSRAEFAADRKKLLNHFFLSRDAFVRFSVGLLLAALLGEPDFQEASQAEAGLMSLQEELRGGFALESQGAAALCDLARVLAEDETWRWLCSLASHRPSPAGRFALLVALDVVQPSSAIILETPGLFDALMASLSDATDVQVRGLAASCILGVLRGISASNPSTLPLRPSLPFSLLGAALAGNSAEALSRLSDSQRLLQAGSEQAQSCINEVSQLRECLSDACAGASELRGHAEMWTSNIETLASSSSSACCATAEIDEALHCLGSKIEVACQRLAQDDAHEQADWLASLPRDPLCDELRDKEAELEDSAFTFEGNLVAEEAQVQKLVEARMSLTRRIAEQDEALKHWTQTCHSAEVRKANHEEADLEECRAQRQAIVASLDAARAQADRLDEELRLAPQRRKAAEVAAQRLAAQVAARSGTLEAFANVESSEGAAQEALRLAARRLRATGRQLHEERRCRSNLRVAVRGLLEKLLVLDSQLESLEFHDSQWQLQAEEAPD